MRHAASAAVVLLVTGCVGRVAPSGDLYRAPPELGADGPVQPSDSSVDVALDGPTASCTPSDAITTCDPLAASPCAGSGGCYLIKGQYLDCVCPPGTVDEGGVCSAATECKPRLTCISSSLQPPGTCRKLCDPANDTSCSTGESCTVIVNYTSLGYCTPSGP